MKTSAIACAFMAISALPSYAVPVPQDSSVTSAPQGAAPAAAPSKPLTTLQKAALYAAAGTVATVALGASAIKFFQGKKDSKAELDAATEATRDDIVSQSQAAEIVTATEAAQQAARDAAESAAEAQQALKIATAKNSAAPENIAPRYVSQDYDETTTDLEEDADVTRGLLDSPRNAVQTDVSSEDFPRRRSLAVSPKHEKTASELTTTSTKRISDGEYISQLRGSSGDDYDANEGYDDVIREKSPYGLTKVRYNYL